MVHNNPNCVFTGKGDGRPWVWGTCAGLILLANTLEETKDGGQTRVGNTLCDWI